jgi:error-prone DNA polymerase
VVPIMNAAMEDRTNIEWDKDDLDALGILKIDVLALGMLTCLAKGFGLMATHHGVTRHDGTPYKPADVPIEEPQVYDMLCKADAVGVFQVESRAQMSMLPRLLPRTFYDLVIEVAIVRPGPIQGDMVHPYLRRRQGKEPVSYPSAELEAVLGKTLGVPLFQEQAMRIAMVGAGFSAVEADRLRRAMATFRRAGGVAQFRDKFIGGMLKNGYTPEFAERCFHQIEGFGEYGFPESHAASFALIAYVSAWMKCHYPAAFACSLLNSQPMGFYAPAQIVSDARAHDVAVLPVDVNRSDWDCTLEGGFHPTPVPSPSRGGEEKIGPSPLWGGEEKISPSPLWGGVGVGGREHPSQPALRLGFRQIKGFKEADGIKLMGARGRGYTHPRELWLQAGLDKGALEKLAEADAFAGIGFSRRDALWAMKGLGLPPPPLLAALDGANEPAVRLAKATLGEEVVDDYRSLHLSLRRHPLGLLRPELTRDRVVPAENLARLENGARVKVAGLAITRQRPGEGTIVFVTLEDESGIANIIIRMRTYEMYRRAVIGAALLAIEGRVQKEGIVIHVVADRCFDWSDRLRKLLPPPVAQDALPAPPPGPGIEPPPLRARSHDFR